MSTIPISEIVQVTPNVLTTGGRGVDMIGLLLTTSWRVPVGAVSSFATADDVGNFFGFSSDEYNAGVKYFDGFENSNVKPGSVLFAQYPTAAVAAYLRGGNTGLTLAQLQALNGTLTLTVDGSSQTATVDLSIAASFSAGAALIETALNSASSFTGSIDPNVVVGRIDPNAGTASISGTTMTVTAVASGAFAPGQEVVGDDVAAGTTIVAQLTGTAGSTGTYQVSISQEVASGDVTSTGATLTVASVTGGALDVGQTLEGTDVEADTTIVAFLTGTGGTGKYAVDIEQTVDAGTTITASGGLLTVTAVASGTLGVGDVLAGAGITAGNHVTSFKSGTGGTGTYFMSVGDTVGSEAMTVAGASVAVTYDSVSASFKIASGTTGTNSTITAATGTLAEPLRLTVVEGAVLSQGADAAAPSAFMTSVAEITQNWAGFATVFDPDVSGNANKLAFASWTTSKNNRFAYVCWDADLSPSTSSPATSSLGYLLQQGDYSGTCLVGRDSNGTVDATYAAFILGIMASLDFAETNGRATFSFRRQSGLLATCSDASAAANLAANGYNFYGAYAGASEQFVFLRPGSVSGIFRWMDSYVNEIWFNSELQSALVNLLLQEKSIPYNVDGYALIQAALQDPVNAALNFGAIRPGVTLSSSQAASVNNAAGVKISDTLQDQGYYVQVKDASPEVRVARGSPPCTIWYMDGQSVQTINLASVNVQ